MSFNLLLERQVGVTWAKAGGVEKSIPARDNVCVRAPRQEKTGTFEELKEDHMVAVKKAK